MRIRVLIITCFLGIAQLLPAQTSVYETYLAHIAAANGAYRLNEPSEMKHWVNSAPAAYRKEWEWRFLARQSDASIGFMPLDSLEPNNMAISADGRLLALPQPDGSVMIRSTAFFDAIDYTLPHHLWSGINPRIAQLNNASLKKITGHRAAVYAAIFSPDGNKLYTCSRDTTIRCVDVETGKEEWRVTSGGFGLARLAMAPDGNQLAFASWYFVKGKGVIGIISTYNTQTGERLQSTEFGVKPILALSYSPDGSKLAIGNWNAEVAIWAVNKLETSPQRFDFADRADYSAIDDLAFSPDSKKIAVASKCGEPRVWSLETGKQLLELRGHRKAVAAIGFTPDGNRIITAGDEGVICFWNAQNGRFEAKMMGHEGKISRICIKEDLNILTLSDDRTIRRWSIQYGSAFANPAGRAKYIYAFGISPDQQWVAMNAPGDSIALWTADGVFVRAFKGLDGGLNALNFSPDGHFVVGSNWGTEAGVWDIHTGTRVQVLNGLEGGSSGCAYSPDGRYVAASSRKNTVLIWDTKNGQLVKKINASTSFYTIVFSPDGKVLAGAGQDGSVVLWETQGFTVIQSWNAHSSQVYTLAFSPDGNQLVSCSEDRTAALWNTGNGTLRYRLKGHAQRVWTVAFSPDGQRVVTGSADRSLVLWDVITGERIMQFPDAREGIYNVLFTPDGKRILANASGDGILEFSK